MDSNKKQKTDGWIAHLKNNKPNFTLALKPPQLIVKPVSHSLQMTSNSPGPWGLFKREVNSVLLKTFWTCRYPGMLFFWSCRIKIKLQKQNVSLHV